MSPSIPARRAVRRPSGLKSILIAVAVATALILLPSEMAGQDPVSGHWLASVQGAGGAPEVVFVLRLEGGAISGRRILPGQAPLDVQGNCNGSSVRLEFRIPEGGGAVEIRIDAEAREDRMDGTWVAVLPSGQRVERPWVAQRTRAGDLNLNTAGSGPGR